MKIISLVDNISSNKKIKSMHGVSFYIETNKHKILFDLGTNDLFIKNAKILNVNLSEVDTVIISHGHSDHGGGLRKFIDINKTANIYIQESAFDKHYFKFLKIPINCGIESGLIHHHQIKLINGSYQIDEELSLLSEITQQSLCADSKKLLTKVNNIYQKDDFKHEHNLVINENNKSALITGCAHKGIINIIDKYLELYQNAPEFVIGGFHLFNPSNKKVEDIKLVEQTAAESNKYNSLFYTCHCTGYAGYEILKKQLKDKINYLKCGEEITL